MKLTTCELQTEGERKTLQVAQTPMNIDVSKSVMFSPFLALQMTEIS